MWWLISPLDIFSLSLGAGGVGLIGERKVDANLLILLAIVGALVFDLAVIKPIINFVARFASPPSEGLEGMVAQSGVAVTKFDEKGRGLVKLILDGQEVQVLASLDDDELIRGVSVRRGDTVTILEVDPNRNTCRVTRELAA